MAEYSESRFKMNTFEKFVCPSCGRVHDPCLSDFTAESGAVKSLPHYIEKYGSKYPYLLFDKTTYGVAGDAVTEILRGAQISFTAHVIEREMPPPDELTVGDAVMYCPPDADMVISVGSGVLNDTGKIVASMKKVPMIIVGTAPSMDGFASATSSMERGGFKLSLNTKCPDCVLGDTELLAKAPKHMIRSGIGDMLAKYISIVEWRLAEIIVGEYYCPLIADKVLSSLDKCVKNAKNVLLGDEDAVKFVMEGLVDSGICMNYATVSRPASGMEHYISHIIDMRSLEFNAPHDLHGIQCGIATLYVIKMYERLTEILERGIDERTAVAHAEAFDYASYSEVMRKKLGRGAESMINGEKKDKKYSLENHRKRLERIIENREEIIAIVRSLPKSQELEGIMRDIGHPVSFGEIGLSEDDARIAVLYAKDIRDKYVLGRLAWDLGINELDLLEE